MSHFAEIDENNIVLRVIVGIDDDPNGDEGLQWITENIGGTWLKTSYNTNGGVHLQDGIPFRKNFAGIGYIYDEQKDAFIPPMPEEGTWVLNEDTCLWEESS